MYWYENDIQRLENEKKNQISNPKTYFLGSSSFTHWSSLCDDFKNRAAVNFGFGGSTLAACTWYFDRIFKDTKPNMIVIYAGDNDLGDNRHPEEVLIFFNQLICKIRSNFGNIPCFYVSIKPSLARWYIIDRIKYTNKIIEQEILNIGGNLYYINIYDKMISSNGFPRREFFELDGLHINKKGYKLWAEVIESHIVTNYDQSLNSF